MDWLVIAGTALTVVGLGLLGYCIFSAVQVKRSDLDDETMRANLQKIVAVNMGALFLSVLGLMIVVVGVMLG
ncbi:hypothetical protein V8J82_18195 [Gymnodinialimonas sp. 2305UL16-5]|uniref:hypothetical protein n=1 Tax=Gymnodinialimonas mytili TaxID=3126503 RepID=UPI0030A60C68